MKKIFFLAVAILSFSFISVQSASAIGMITQPIIVKDILRGQETLATITLLNSEDKETTYGLKTEGQIANWVTFYKIDDKELKSPITEIKMPVKDYTDIKVKFSVPKDAPNGEYKGKILVFMIASREIQSEQVSVNVSQQVSKEVTINVTDKEIIDLEASVIPASYGINSGKPLKIRMDYYNKGNVLVKPDVQLTIKKDGKSIFNATFSYPESEEPIKIQERKTLSYVEWSTSGQENGKYTAEIKILNNGNVIAEDSFNFSIGYFQSGVWVSAISFLGGGNLGLGWVVLGVILLVIVALLNILDRKGFNFLRKLF